MPLEDLRPGSEKLAREQEQKQEKDSKKLDPPFKEPIDIDNFYRIDNVIYFNPDHQEDLNFTPEIIENAKNGIRIFQFEPLTITELKEWSPFSTGAIEKNFVEHGFATVVGVLDCPPAPSNGRGAPLRHLAREASLQALHFLTLIAKAAIDAPRTRKRPVWLKADAQAILAPVCGRESVTAGKKTDKAGEVCRVDIPMTQQGELLVGCVNFSGKEHDVFPSYCGTPNSFLKNGADFIRSNRVYNPSDLSKQICLEIKNLAVAVGGDFDPDAATLWLLQNIMMIRFSVEEVRRYYTQRPLLLTPEQKRRINEDTLEFRKIVLNHGMEAQRTSRNTISENVAKNFDDQPYFKDPMIATNTSDLRIRMLTLFYGGVVIPTEDEEEERRHGHVLALAEWLGQLRWTGEANLNKYIASSILSIIYFDHDDEMCFDTRERGGSSSWLEAMLPKVAWQLLIEAAQHVADTPYPVPFTVSYTFVNLRHSRPSGEVKIEACQLKLIGPLLMLPLRDAKHWVKLLHSVPDAGLYAVPAP